MNEINQIVSDIKNGVVKPIYFLMGEESYYIDKISDFIEDTILEEEEKGFNQTVMYGRDVTVEDIIGAAKRFPMMAEKQVIIVKEALCWYLIISIRNWTEENLYLKLFIR